MPEIALTLRHEIIVGRALLQGGKGQRPLDRAEMPVEIDAYAVLWVQGAS